MAHQIKLSHRERVGQIMSTALELAVKSGYQNVTRDAVAIKLGIPPSLIPYHIGGMDRFRRMLMKRAVQQECLPVVAQGVVAHDTIALKAPKELRQRALASLA